MKSICKAMELRLLAPVPDVWTIPKRLRKIIPPKVALFLWQSVFNKIAVKANLVERGMALENAGRCNMCGLKVESVAHLLLACVKTGPLSSGILNREGVAWCSLNSILRLVEE